MTTPLSIDRRQFVSSALLILLAGCATPAVRLAETTQTIPFLTADVARVADSDSYRITWQAENVRHVAIYASADPSPFTRGRAVAHGAATGDVTAPGLTGALRTYFTLVPDRGAPLVVADRAMHLPSIPNLRDIGGYRTSDGRWVKMGLLYRSDQLDRMTDADLAEMTRLGLRLVVDLRTASERAREPDRLPAGARPLVLDVIADSQNSLGGDMRKAMAAIATGKGVELLTAANRDFVTLGSARRGYGTLLGELGTAQAGPTLYHCTGGKDRTGWATAVILTLLGVPRETVMADYLASNIFLERKNAAALEALAKSGSPIPPAYLEQVMTARRQFLEAAFEEVDLRFGSFDGYLHNGLGLNADQVAELRKAYLQ